jgi:2'-5' RNA ligase
MGFQENWERRDSIEPTVKKVPDRTDFTTLVVQVESQELIESLAEIQDKISDIDCVDPVPRDYFHVTVKLGGFIVDEPEADDELSEEDLDEVATSARDIISSHESFAINVEKLNLFPNAVFAEVHDGSGRLEDLHDELAQLDELMPSPHDYLPHITLCHFQNQNEFQELVDRLEDTRNRSFGELEVEEVCLVRDDLERYADLHGERNSEVVKCFSMRTQN